VQDTFRLTIVDGFAGGGVYRHETTGQVVFGSPLILLETAKEAACQINENRSKKIDFKIDFFFIEENANTAAVLKNQLIDHGYGPQLGESIQLINDVFSNCANSISHFIKKKGRMARSIFLLDQYGYSDVPAQQIRSLLTNLPGAEVILTFAVDSFLTYASDSATTCQLLHKIGIPDCLRGRSIKEIKQSEKKWRLYIQSSMYRELVEKCGAPFYTPFFIRSTQGHGDYWLIHLSQHARARDVMTGIHWEKNNHFIHYGGAGLDMFQMLGYDPGEDSGFTQQNAFCFDINARQQSVSMLATQIPDLIYSAPGGLSFGELFSFTCNSSPASAEIYREAVGFLLEHKDLEVVNQAGGTRRSANSIHNNDQILPPRQRSFTFV
jgi:three-Cys-motif partner protein